MINNYELTPTNFLFLFSFVSRVMHSIICIHSIIIDIILNENNYSIFM